MAGLPQKVEEFFRDLDLDTEAPDLIPVPDGWYELVIDDAYTKQEHCHRYDGNRLTYKDILRAEFTVVAPLFIGAKIRTEYDLIEVFIQDSTTVLAQRLDNHNCCKVYGLVKSCGCNLGNFDASDLIGKHVLAQVYGGYSLNNTYRNLIEFRPVKAREEEVGDDEKG